MQYFFKKIIITFLLISVVLSNFAFVAYCDDISTSITNKPQSILKDPSIVLDIATPSAILIDSKTGNILFEKNSNEKMYPASITKIMTAILALEKGDLNKTIKMSHKSVYDVDAGSSNAGFSEGEELTLEQLLNALLIYSANESANAIAEYIGGTKENFAQMMTQRAKELGAKNTNFVTPSGLHNPNHYTTAYDMAMIAKYALTIPKFREIVKTLNYTLSPTNVCPNPKELHNKNQLMLRSSKYYYPYAIGVKTGYTTVAGSTLVSAAVKNNIELISVVLNSPIEDVNSYMYIDSKKMFEYGFENYFAHKVYSKNEIIDKVRIKGSRQKVTAVVPEDVNVLLKKGDDPNKIKYIKQINPLTAPVKKGDTLGYMSFSYNGRDYGKIKIIADDNVEVSAGGFLSPPKNPTVLNIVGYIFKWIGFILLIIIGILLVLALGVLAYMYIRYRCTRKKRKNKYKF